MEQSTLVIFTAVVTAIAAVSEALALIPGMKSNGILHFIINITKSVLGKK